ncbi:hypothetical protein Acr_00g0004180 [Actinidia rufa]|uniref:Uncharacterized protein n=1 Tax=Actinidia rufa TaxID=165716 RepID=A0A7J0D7E6_9ERIC|nr:hypothetical protein Acr_00g0004180 [Actinidia rufa]
MERGLPVLQIGTELETPQRMRFRLGNSFLSDLPHCRRKEPEQPLEEGNTARLSIRKRKSLAIASSPGQSSQRGVGSAKIDGKLPGLGFAISSVLSSVPCLDLFGFKVGVLFFHFQLSLPVPSSGSGLSSSCSIFLFPMSCHFPLLLHTKKVLSKEDFSSVFSYSFSSATDRSSRSSACLMCYSTGLAYCLSRGLSLLRFFTEDAGFDRLRKVSPIYLFGKKALLELGWLNLSLSLLKAGNRNVIPTLILTSGEDRGGFVPPGSDIGLSIASGSSAEIAGIEELDRCRRKARLRSSIFRGRKRAWDWRSAGKGKCG